MKTALALALLFALASANNHVSKVLDWRTASIYQVLTDRLFSNDRVPQCAKLNEYCGGTFTDLITLLPYISDVLGFDALYISPFVENTDLGYHGYWARNIYRVNPHFGSEADLRRLVLESHKRGLKVMVDVVFNHVGYVRGGNDFSEIVPFNSEKMHYHLACDIQDRDW